MVYPKLAVFKKEHRWNNHWIIENDGDVGRPVQQVLHQLNGSAFGSVEYFIIDMFVGHISGWIFSAISRDVFGGRFRARTWRRLRRRDRMIQCMAALQKRRPGWREGEFSMGHWVVMSSLDWPQTAGLNWERYHFWVSNHDWLAGGDWNHGILCSIQLGMSSSQLTFTPWFFRGVGGSTTKQMTIGWIAPKKNHGLSIRELTWDFHLESHWRFYRLEMNGPCGITLI